MFSKTKRRVYEIVQPAESSDAASKLFDWLIILLIAANVLLVILDTFDNSEAVKQIFYAVEFWSVLVFTVEYLMRFWTATYIYPDRRPAFARLRYALSFMAVIDLLAILPFYLPFVIPVDLRVLRMVRLLRLLRLLKVNRYTAALSTVGGVIRRKSTQLLSSMFVVLILMVIASVLMYSIENEAQPEVFTNAFTGLWWAVATLTTVGYGDIFPVTAVGKALSAVIALLGIGLVAVPTGIISAGFVEVVDHGSESAEGAKHYCPYCGKKID